MAVFPAGLVSSAQLPATRSNADAQLNSHPADHNTLAQEVIAIEAELGINPRGAQTSVRARLDAIQPGAPSAYTLTNTPTADRSIDYNSTNMAEMLAVLMTLIVDLKARGIVG
jgi:hypothetical protein